MIESILSNDDLVPLVRNAIQENSAGVSLDADFYLEDGSLDNDLIVNLAIDEFYNGLGLGDTPPSIDNLVVIKRAEKKFSIYLIELKDVRRIGSIKFDNIKKKFDNTLKDFMLDRYQGEFNIDDVKITDFNLWLVCNRFKFMGSDLSDEAFERKVKNTLLEKLMLMPPFKYKGKISTIDLMVNNAEIC